MKIRNRLQDIRDAQTQVLQDFFELEVVPYFPNNQWISELYTIVQNDQSSSSYAGTWSKFRRSGVQGFSVKDMDTTIIIAVLGWKNNLTNKVNFNQFKHIQKRFSTITDDRNFNAHMNSNEIYSARIGYRTDLDQMTRNSILLEEIVNMLGISDTLLREDSITYQYSNENLALSDVDWILLKLLYHPEILCGMDARSCGEVIEELYY